jgi:thioredoxin-dependent peroxiredoxin
VVKKSSATARPKIAKPSPKLAKGTPAPLLNSELPDFSLPSTASHEFNLKAHAGKKVVLFFYPRDATPGCTIEGHEFSKLLHQFHEAGTEVYGVSRDNMKSHCKFRDKEGYSVHLLSDENEKLCELFQVIKEKNMYGKKVFGIERSTFVIDEKGCLVLEWRGVKVEGHAQAVLDAIREI